MSTRIAECFWRIFLSVLFFVACLIINNKDMSLFHVNFFATLYFNFKMLPLRLAIKLPFVLYFKIKFVNCNGHVVFPSNNVKFKMVQIGANGSDMFGHLCTTIDVRGNIIIRGSGIRVGHGSLLRVEKDGTLDFSEGSILGARNIIFCCKSIKFEQNCLFSWDCQILDSDTHSIKDMVSGEIKPKTQDIVIGKNSWIGNHVIINKGTVLPEGTIVSAMSLLNKDYSIILNKNSVIGGIPARKLRENKLRMNDKL